MTALGEKSLEVKKKRTRIPYSFSNKSCIYIVYVILTLSFALLAYSLPTNCRIANARMFLFAVTSIILKIGEAPHPGSPLPLPTDQAGDPIYRVAAVSSVECGDICVVLEECRSFLFLPNKFPAFFQAEGSEKWNCLIFDNVVEFQKADTGFVAVDRVSFEQIRCTHVSDSLKRGHSFLMRHHGKTLFLGNTLDDRKAWRRTRGSLLTPTVNGTVSFRNRDVCLGWRTDPDEAQFSELVLERCVDDPNYTFQFLDLTSVIPDPGECKWIMSSRQTKGGSLIKSRRMKISEDQTCELEPPGFFAKGGRYPEQAIALIDEKNENYPWEKLLFVVETRVSLGTCKRNETVITHGEILPGPFNAPLFLSGDEITVTCDEGTTMPGGLSSVVIICDRNKRHSFACKKSKGFIIHIFVAAFRSRVKFYW